MNNLKKGFTINQKTKRMGPMKIEKNFNMYFVNLVVCLKQE